MADWGFTEGAQRLDTYGETASTSAGTTIAAPGSANTKGAYTQLAASTAFDAVGIVISGSITGSAALSALLDIAIGPAGSETVIVPDISMFRGASLNCAFPPVFIPIAIPAGSRIAARVQSTATSVSLSLSAAVIAATAGYPILAQKAAAYGVNAATSKGAIVDPGATANTKGAYSELIAATTMRSQWMVVTAVPDTAPLATNWLLDIAVGDAGSEQLVIQDIHIGALANIGASQHRFFIPLALPAGVRVSARLACASTAAGRNLQVSIIALG